ncbi:MAG: TM2 domain-containing protein [Eggerthellaceae bacterium]|nr:TM2 domain-containing protein [Eggerthellaceae bacterium]
MSDQDHWGNPVRSQSETESAYWQGTYRGPDYAAQSDVPDSPSYGSMSYAARQSYAAEAIRKKDHVSAGLLAIFLGMFGVHKFYLGCNNAGFIMLAVSIIGGIFTFGLAAAVIWLIAVIEGIIYLTKTQTEFDNIYVLNQRDWF